MKKIREKIVEIVKVAAILATIASLLASVCWISSSKAGGEANDLKTAALGFMILRLESSTQASTALVQAQSYLTQAGMYYAEADATDDNELKSYYNSLGNQSWEMSKFHSNISEEAEAKSQSYFSNYTDTIDKASILSTVADYRSTGALTFTISAIIASSGSLFKRREVLYAYIPVFFLAFLFLIFSLL